MMEKFVKTLVFAALMSLTSAQIWEDIDCPGFSSPDYEYWFHDTPDTLANHEIQCLVQLDPQYTARLVILDSQAKSNCLMKYIIEEKDPLQQEQYAIGLRDIPYEGIWEWQHPIESLNETAAVENSHWIPGRPDALIAEGCAFVSVGPKSEEIYNGWWDHANCNADGFYSICERVSIV